MLDSCMGACLCEVLCACIRSSVGVNATVLPSQTILQRTRGRLSQYLKHVVFLVSVATGLDQLVCGRVQQRVVLPEPHYEAHERLHVCGDIAIVVSKRAVQPLIILNQATGQVVTNLVWDHLVAVLRSVPRMLRVLPRHVR